MTNFLNHREIEKIKSKWKYGDIDIVITTFNRLPYLQKCVNSILATKKGNGKIIVHDDGSTDGTVEWLKLMVDRKKINKVIFSNGIGTANAFNKGVKESNSNILILSNDDMYFYRYWNFAVMNTFNEAKKCGLVTFYDYSRIRLDNGKVDNNKDFYRIIRSGMGCTAVKREIYDAVNGFNLKGKSKMGYFASSFCEKVNKLDIKMPVSLHYCTNPNFAIHMDHPNSILNDRDILQKYCDFRKENKKGKTSIEYLNSYNIKIGIGK